MMICELSKVIQTEHRHAVREDSVLKMMDEYIRQHCLYFQNSSGSIISQSFAIAGTISVCLLQGLLSPMDLTSVLVNI